MDRSDTGIQENYVENNEAAVLFSGGRDSSLSCCLLAISGLHIQLLSFNDGIGIHKDVANYRVEELRTVFPGNILAWNKIDISGLFRKIAIADIESDFAKYKKNLILLGNKLAMHAAATVFCVRNGITILADGSATYQSHFAEQMPAALTEFRGFHRRYDMTYINPVWEYPTEDSVKYTLLEFGVSSKSLEGITVFGDSFSDPKPETVTEYIHDKLPICNSYVDMMLNTDVTKTLLT